jgi:cysteine synthase A
MIFADITSTVGRTPLVALQRLRPKNGARVLLKLESRNPCGSVKDRVGVALIEDAERRGRMAAGATLVEPTSGNTGIALAFTAAAKGYKLILTMPERISQERVAFLRLLGAEIIFTPGSLMREAVKKAEQIVAETDGAIMLQQFNNPANPEIHRKTTAEEIWADTSGEVDVFVAGVGTGGTITGVGEVLKARRKGVHVVAVEPATAAVLSGCEPGPHYIPGLGAGFIPEVLNREVIDEVVPIAEETALRAQVRLAREEGISVGLSGGAALAAVLSVASRPQFAGKTLVAVMPDGGERYTSNPLYLELLKSIASQR